jgi:adenosylcobyric acid synthase
MQNSKPHKPPAACLAVLGTGSDVGKSIIVTALCRWFARQGMRVSPYKAQNMSNNSGVTPEGLEMGRAQIVQAEAAKIPPRVDMNPILLKPTSEVGAQVVVLGQALENSTAATYHKKKETLFTIACEALNRLRQEYDLVILEGAGSCAEVNLMDHDIVNFRMAEYAKAPVILVGDIHRGGIFAQLVGTLGCLPDDRQQRIRGFIVNRFRGDIHLFKDGVDWLEKHTGRPVYGVLPWQADLGIESEDSVTIENPPVVGLADSDPPAVAVIRIPHISNFTDFDALFAINGLQVHFVEKVQSLENFKAVILPGSKNTCFDLKWLSDCGWAERLIDYARSGGHILGICGGYQMMGERVEDPYGLEGACAITPGLSLLPVETVLMAPKVTTLTRFAWDGAIGAGYEIHMGQTRRLQGSPLFCVSARNQLPMQDVDGCISPDGHRMGTYLHGLFDSPAITAKWLAGIGLGHLAVPQTSGPVARDRAYDRLAEHFEKHIDVTAIAQLIRR